MNELERRLEDVTVLDVAVIGCVVNGPGEALKADLGVTSSNHQSVLYREESPPSAWITKALPITSNG